jgi:hypothetical protein
MNPRFLAPVLVVTALVSAACGDGDTDISARSDGEATSTTEPTPTPTPDSTPEPTMTPTAESTPEITSDPTPTPDPEPVLTLDLTDLPALSGGALYEAWLIVDGAPVSAGTFDGTATTVELTATVGMAEAVVVSIEPAGDADPAPSTTKVLAGPLVDGAANLTIADPAALGADFADASGGYILATPTSATLDDERSGIWWTDIPRAPSLFLPPPPEGWIYEGWLSVDGIDVTTGRFADTFAADASAPFSGPIPGPPLVGEDLIVNAPDGLVFPLDLRSQVTFITLEPLTDDSPEPYGITPLRGEIPADAIDHVLYPAENTADRVPSGTASLAP